jgi:hypothetical protein
MPGKQMNFAPKSQPEMGTFKLTDNIRKAFMKMKKGSKKKNVLATRDTQGKNSGIIKGTSLFKDMNHQLGTASTKFSKTGK